MIRLVSLRLSVLLLALLVAATAHAKALKQRDHTTERGGAKLALIEKWKGGEEPKWKANGKVILLVHGATWSSRCTFDPAPGYSLMDALAEDGWDVWAVDLHNYGASTSGASDWTDAASAAADVDTAADYIRAFRWVERVHVLGYQWGSQVAALFAEAHANKVARLALFGMRYQLFDKAPPPTTRTRSNPPSAAMLKPDDGDLDPEVVKRRAEVCSLHDPSSPNGALRDLGRPSASQPKRVTVPTLLVQGERDGDDAALADRLDYFKALGTRARSFVNLPGLGKHAALERNHARLEHALLDFLDAP